MKNEELKEAIAKYIESKELVLMGYSPEYIDDVKTDMEIAFRAGAEWMAGQGITVGGTFHHSCGYPSVIILNTYLRDYEGEEVIVQIRKKQ